MPVRQATVASRVGLHARPASLFVAEATKLGVPVTIQVGERPAVDARSMLAVMTLGAKCGDVVTLSSDAEGAGSLFTDTWPMFFFGFVAVFVSTGQFGFKLGKPARAAIKEMVRHKIVDVLGCNGKA